MANFKECWWLTRVLNGDFCSGGYRDGKGYSLNQIYDCFTKEFKTFFNILEPGGHKAFSVKIYRLRVKLYYLFGLITKSDSTPGTIKGHGYGGYFYYLENPEILNGPGMTLSEYVELLAENGNNVPEKLPWDSGTSYSVPASPSLGSITARSVPSIGFISADARAPEPVFDEENLEFVQFAMLFGEILTIEFGKVRAGVDIDAPYSFEPYQIKEIEGRWYAIGNIYPIGHREQAELAVYDVARLRLADEENPDVRYEPVNGFDIGQRIMNDLPYLKAMKGVQTIDIKTLTEESSDYILGHPLCSAQESIRRGVVRIYGNLTADFILLLGAYGDEIFISVPQKEGCAENERRLISSAVNYFRQRTSEVENRQKDNKHNIQMKAKRFNLNGGKPQTLRDIARDVLSDFAARNPSKTAQEIRDIFVDACKEVKVPHVVETEPEYHLRDGESSQVRSASEITIPNGEKLYISSQWHAKYPDDDFFLFMDVAKRNGWGIIARV